MKQTCDEGAPTGTGAASTLDRCSKEVGEGRMTITEGDDRPNGLGIQRIKLRILFRPFTLPPTLLRFTFKLPEGNQSVITWGMSGDKNFTGQGAVHLSP